MLHIEIIKPGLLTCVQDEGRLGMAYYAIPASGPMDADAARLANLLVGNSKKQAVLECHFMAPHIYFEQTTIISLTGADLQWMLDGKPVKRNRTLNIAAKSILSGKSAINGARGYVAIKGDWQLEKILGSSATYSYAQLGGIDGSALKKGDRIAIKASSKKTNQTILIEQAFDYNSIDQITFHPGPEWDLLPPSAQQAFLTNQYNISPNSNRMGARLIGEAISLVGFEKMDSSGVFPGVVQLPTDGQPLVLLQDCQTTGGYPRIAVLEAAELWRLGQVLPGQEIRFRIASQAEH